MYVYIYKCMYMSICILQGFYTSQSDGHVDHNQNMFVFEPCHCKLTHDLCLQKASQLVRFALLNSNKTKNPVKQTRFDHAPKTRANFYQPDALKKKKTVVCLMRNEKTFQISGIWGGQIRLCHVSNFNVRSMIFSFLFLSHSIHVCYIW